jgi:hypothetical protein
MTTAQLIDTTAAMWYTKIKKYLPLVQQADTALFLREI